jgi:hypothetical protein
MTALSSGPGFGQVQRWEPAQGNTKGEVSEWRTAITRRREKSDSTTLLTREGGIRIGCARTTQSEADGFMPKRAEVGGAPPHSANAGATGGDTETDRRVPPLTISPI